MKKIGVTVFEDNLHLRDSLYFLINSEADMECLSAQPNANNIANAFKPQLPDVVPVRVRDDERDGQACKALELASDDDSQQLVLYFDPDTHLLEGAEGRLRRGDGLAC